MHHFFFVRTSSAYAQRPRAKVRATRSFFLLKRMSRVLVELVEEKKRITPVRWYGTTTGTGLGFGTVLRDYFDFFRILNKQEALDVGLFTYFDSSAYCFVEWPSKIGELLPNDFVHVYIDLENHKRIIKLVLND